MGPRLRGDTRPIDARTLPLPLRPAAAERAEQVDLRIGDARVGERERSLGFGEGAFGVERFEPVERKSVGWGKSGSVRVDLGGRLILTNNKLDKVEQNTMKT